MIRVSLFRVSKGRFAHLPRIFISPVVDARPVGRTGFPLHSPYQVAKLTVMVGRFGGTR